MGPNSTNMSILRFSSFALLLVLLIHSAAARPLSEVVTEAVNDSPSVAADQEKIENVDARTNDKPALSDAVVPEDYLELSQMAARVGTEPQPCASCDQVPCGHCQEGCSGSDCTPLYSMDKPDSLSRNWCANNNAGLVPPQCRPEAATAATAATGSCASCDQVPCGHCQDGCPGSECTPLYSMDKPDSTSRNWCANNSAGIVPPQCRPEASTPTPTPTPTPTGAPTPTPSPTDAPTPTPNPTDAPTAPIVSPTASTIDCNYLTAHAGMTSEKCACLHGTWTPQNPCHIGTLSASGPGAGFSIGGPGGAGITMRG